jgi:hypothetical protein
MNAKQRAVLLRIKQLEDELAKGREFLETGAHADWRGFRPLFTVKRKHGKALPPHPDWVRNVFIPRRERSLSQAEKVLERLGSKRCINQDREVENGGDQA